MLQVVSPYNLELIKEIPIIGINEVEKQLQTAYALFEDQSNWLPAHQRIAILEKTAEIMKGRV